MRKLFTFLFAALMSVASMWAQTETLLTTITATGTEQASYSTANVATVSFSHTAGGASAYLANWGWWGYGWSATVNAAEGYTITKCVFYDDQNRTATDSEAPFVVETTEEDKTPKVNGTPILEDTSKGIKKIDVYGYATPEPDPAKYYIVGSMNSWQVDENYEMNPSLDAETEEYIYTLDLTTTSEFKVVKVQNGQQSWIPEGMGNNYGENGEITEDGEYTVYFRPNYDGGEDWFYSCIYVEKTGEFVPEEPTYYLIGNMTGWDVDENYELNPNIDSDIEEYFYVLDLTTSSQFKVVKVQNGQQTWYPSGMGNNYGENGEITEDGEYTVYFRPNYNGGDDWFYNCIYVSKNEPEPEPESETLETNKGDAAYNGAHFSVTPNPGQEGDSKGFWVTYTDHATISALNGETIIAVELTVGDGEDFIPYFGVSEGEVSYSGSLITITDVNASSIELLMTYVSALQISQVKIYYTEATAVSYQQSAISSQKIIRDGQIMIIKGDKTYNVQGTIVR